LQILASPEERVPSRLVLYRKREPYTAILLDEEPDEDRVFGQLPQPDPPSVEAVRLAYLFRSVGKLSDFVQLINPGPLASTPKAFDGIDHFVLASGRIKNDRTGMQALRQWLEQGGKLWVMLDRVEPDAIAPLLGDALDFQVVDRVSLTTIKIETPGNGLPAPKPQQHEQPVDFVRVLLPPQESVVHTINGWPVWFSRMVGRGKVVFTTLAPRGWYTQETPKEPPLPYDNSPMELLVDELQMSPEDPYRVEAFRPGLIEEIGYSVVNRATVGLVFG